MHDDLLISFVSGQVLSKRHDRSTDAFSLQVVLDGHLPKAECRDLKPGDEIWVLDNYYATPVRPEQFRLSLRRLLVEYPEPLLLLFLVGIWRVRKALAKAQRDLPPPTVLFKDDFHRRAERFDPSKAPKA